MDFDSLSRQSNKQTLIRAEICHCDHGTPLPSSHCRLPRKLRLTLTLMVSWNHSSLTWMNAQRRQQKYIKKLQTMTSIWTEALSKVAQNETPSDGLIRVAKACRHLFFPSPISILQIHDEQTGIPQYSNDNLKHCFERSAYIDSAVDTGRKQPSCPAGCRCPAHLHRTTPCWVSPSWLPRALEDGFSQSTKFERYGTVLDMNANHELTAQIAKMIAVLNLCHVSSENVPKQNEQNSVWGQHFFRSSTSPTAPVILKGLPTNSKPPLPSCKVNSQNIQTQTRVAQAACPQPISWLARKTWTHGWRKSLDKVLAEQTT